MANYSISATPSGSSKKNAAERNLSEVFPYGAGTYKTISALTRQNGIWCNCGGTVQSVVLEGYDQLINASTGAVIKTSGTAQCTCRGAGPSTENYMTTSFTGWTQAESNAAVAAWAAGSLRIRRVVSIKSYTSSKHGQPSFRDGYYDDTITIQGATVPFTDYRPAIAAFSVMRSDDGVTASQLSTTVYARIQLAMNNAAGLNDSPKLVIQYSTKNDFSGAASLTLGSTQAEISPYLKLSVVKLSGTFSAGSSYYFQLGFSAGGEAAAPREASVSMAYTPVHIPESNAGVAFGMYSNATANDRRFEVAYPAYLYGGIAQIGDGWTEIAPLAGTTPADYGGGALRCRAIGDKRIIDGSVLVTPKSSAVLLAKLPSGYAPVKSVLALNPCSGGRVARIVAYGASESDAGYLGLEWVRNLSDGSNYTSAAIWVQCSIEYWV